MTDEFDFPQSSKRRKISTYATRRSTLNTEQDGDTVNEISTTPRVSNKRYGSRDHAINDVTVESPTKISVHEPGEEALSFTTDDSATSTTMESNPINSSRRSATNSKGSTVGRRVSKRKSDHKEPVEMEGGEVVNVSQDNETGSLSFMSEQDHQDKRDPLAVQPRSSGRERKRPRRFSISPQKPKPVLPDTDRRKTRDTRRSPDTPLKGILTPSRREKRGPGKSVVFDQEDKDIEQHFGFKDIDSSTKKTTKTSKAILKSLSGKNRRDKEDVQLPVPEESLDSEFDDDLDQGADTEDISIAQIIDDQYPVVGSNPDEADAITLQPVENDPALLAVKATILARLIDHSNSEISAIPPYLQSQYSTIYTLLKATVTDGESNSLLLLGSRGNGKSHLLAHALHELTSEYHSDFHSVHLNGFFQTDDKIALREIWRQLGREMNVDENETDEVSGSYADTMASLLSLLSHPEEFGVSSSVDGEAEVSQHGQRRSKSIVFILDEFDLFTTHPRQTLLYNLFDIAQSRKAPIAVIGCSTRMDVVESLEKRVKSRFSHRWVHMPSTKSLDAFEEIVKNVLCIKEDMETSKDEQLMRQRWNQYIQKNFLISLEIQNLIKRIFYTSKAVPDLFAALYLPVATMRLPSEADSMEMRSTATLSTVTLTPPSLLTILPNVSTIHLSLLVAAARLETIHNLSAVNFNLVYNHYSELIGRTKIQQTASGALVVGGGLRQWNRITAKGVWEELSRWHLIVPVNAGAGSKDGGNDMIGGEGASIRMCKVDVTLDDLSWALKERGGGIVDVLGKWCREI